MMKVFISHVHNDEALVRKIVAILKTGRARGLGMIVKSYPEITGQNKLLKR